MDCEFEGNSWQALINDGKTMDNFSNKQFEAILNKAAEIQADLDLSDDLFEKELSLDDLESIAAESGISQEALDLALKAVGEETLPDKDQRGLGQKTAETRMNPIVVAHSRLKALGQGMKSVRLGDIILISMFVSFFGFPVALYGLGSKATYIHDSYRSLANDIEPHILMVARGKTSTQQAVQGIDLALEKFESHKLWKTTLNHQPDETSGFWHKNFIPAPDPALIQFHQALTGIGDQPVPNPQQVKQLTEDYLQPEALFPETLFQSEIYDQAYLELTFMILTLVACEFALSFLFYFIRFCEGSSLFD